MPYDFHEDRITYFQHQTETTKNFIIPFILTRYPISADTKVLEIGCGEAGVLKAFTELGCQCTGVELHEPKLELARELMAEELKEGLVQFINKNIYDEEFKQEFLGTFDIIILKDVIEHIPDQHNLMDYLHTFLRPNGVIFFSFPPWYMPFGGHQQMCQSKLKKLPYFHLFPTGIYKAILKYAAESDTVINGLMANKRTGITIERFERILSKTGYKTLEKQHYLFNPIYKYKFNLEPKVQYRPISVLPYFRDFFTTAVYYLVQPE